MKKLWRSLLLFLLMALLLGASALAAAPEGAEPETPELLYGEDDVSDVILQAGGFPRASVPRRGDPYAGAKQALYEGLRAHAVSVDLSAYSVPRDAIGGIYADVINAHPELFYAKNGYSWSATYDNVITTIRPMYYEEFGDAEISAFNAKCASILAKLEPGWTAFQKALFLHDYLVTHCEYDLTYTYYDAYHALVTGSAVCQGYSLAYACLCRQAGLEITCVSSEGLNHAWNLITVDGEQFYVDCTWDDPANYWYEGYCKHEYFLCSRDAFGHIENDGEFFFDWVSGSSEIYYSVIGSDRYDTAWFRGSDGTCGVNTVIAMIGDIAAYVDGSYVNARDIYLRRLSTDEVQTVELDMPSYWNVWGTNSIYTSNYTSFALLGGSFYYTTAFRIYSLSTTGETELVYTLTSEEQTEGYIYGLVNDDGTLYYNLGTIAYNNEDFIRTALTAVPPELTLEIVEQPEDQEVEAGETAIFSVFVEAEGPVSYQWYVKKTANGDWTAISAASAKTASYSLTTQLKHNGYQYKCFVSDGETELWSEVVTLTVTAAAPSLEIVDQPMDVDVEVGEEAIFSVFVEATGPVSYQWYVKKTPDGGWTAISAASAKTADYCLTAQLKHNGYQYKCKVSDGTTVLWSEVVMLTVTEPAPALEIVEQPEDVVVGVGEEAIFSVYVEATGPVSYQWYVRKTANGDWSAISAASAKTADYRLTAALRHDGYAYKCKVSDGGITVWSEVALLTVEETQALEIVDQPMDVDVEVGEEAIFSVFVEASGPVSYQWFVKKTANGDWSAISAASAKTADYRLTAAERHNGYQYKCRVSDGATVLWSEVVTLTVGAPLRFTRQPEDIVGAIGDTVAFRIAASGGEGALSYQWYVKKTANGDWSAISASSAKTASYSLTLQARHNGYQYKCRVSDGATVIWSDLATLTVGEAVPAITITRQPADVRVAAGSTATFTVTAEGSGALSYQWYVKKTADGDWAEVRSDAGKLASYSLSALMRHNGYQYKCKVTDGGSELWSDIATLTVR